MFPTMFPNMFPTMFPNMFPNMFPTNKTCIFSYVSKFLTCVLTCVRSDSPDAPAPPPPPAALDTLPDFTEPADSHKSDIAAILSAPTPSYDVSASAPSFTDSGEVNVAATDTSADAGQIS